MSENGERSCPQMSGFVHGTKKFSLEEKKSENIHI